MTARYTTLGEIRDRHARRYAENMERAEQVAERLTGQPSPLLAACLAAYSDINNDLNKCSASACFDSNDPDTTIITVRKTRRKSMDES